MHQGRERRILRLTVIGSDAIAIALAFAAAWTITLRSHNQANVPFSANRLTHLGIYVIGWMLLLAAYHQYDLESLLDGFLQYERIAHASTTGLLLLIGILAVLEGDTLIPRSLLLLSWVLSVVSLGSSRFVMRRIVRRMRQLGFFRARTLIVGAGEDGLALADQIRASASASTDVVGLLDEFMAKGTLIQGYEVLGEPLEMARVARETHATEAILVPQAISWESLKVLIEGEPASWGLQRLWLAPAIRDLLTTGMEIHRRGSLPLLSVTGLRIGGLEAFLKRSLDLTLTLLLLPVILPVCATITLWLVAIRRVNPIARRQMIGAGRRRFTMYTFPPEAPLRQLHIWRLPALFNVVCGDLSLVGPRPIASALAVRYRAWSSMLACVRPGLTGPWWLLSGTRGLFIEAEVADDLGYIRNYSIWLDLHILARTVRKLFSRIELGELEPETAGQPTDIVAPTGARTP
jgi:lipopolysaccharide/colanic/teichoic acid biosynthesis glycosyltransferase